MSVNIYLTPSFCFWPHCVAHRISHLSNQGLNPGPWPQKLQVLTTGLLGKFFQCQFLKNNLKKSKIWFSHLKIYNEYIYFLVSWMHLETLNCFKFRKHYLSLLLQQYCWCKFPTEHSQSLGKKKIQTEGLFLNYVCVQVIFRNILLLLLLFQHMFGRNICLPT